MTRILSATVLALVLVPVVAAAPPGADLPAVQDVLDRFVEAVGGAEACARADVRHYRGTIVQDLTWTDPRHQEVPFRAEATAAGLVRYAEVDAWSALPATDAADLRSKLRWVLHPQYARQVETFFPQLEVAGREARAGRPVILLRPRELKPEYYTLYFDEETGLLSHIGYHNDLQDWREVDGVLYPHRWVFGRKGGHTTYVFEEVTTGPAPAD